MKKANENGRLPRQSFPPWTDKIGEGKVYFLWAEGTSYFKIGFTQQSLRKRVANMQTGCPMPLRFLGAGLASPQDEKVLHQHLAPFHAIGEWFDLPTEALTTLAEVFHCPVFGGQVA